MIKVKEICKKFGENEILDKITLEVSSGEVVGLVGLNGAGKTTLLRLILGILTPDAGNSEILGEVPSPRNCKVLKKTGVILENDGFNGNFTFLENMQFFAKIKGVEQEELQNYIDGNWALLQKKAKRQVKFFSKGERMQCAIARAFLGNPKAVILDEPTTGLDYEQCEVFFETVKKAQADGAATIISSHNFFALDKLCTRVTELKNAKIKDISDGFFTRF